MQLNGNWNNPNSGGYDGTYSTSSDANTAVYTFSGLTVGQQYEVLATWVADPVNNTACATYSVVSGTQQVSGTTDQQLPPAADLVLGGCNWQSVVTFTAGSGGTATVTLGGPADGLQLVADGVQVLEARPATSDSYDTAGNLIAETLPDGSRETWSYNDSDYTDTSSGTPVPIDLLQNSTQWAYSQSEQAYTAQEQTVYSYDSVPISGAEAPPYYTSNGDLLSVERESLGPNADGTENLDNQGQNMAADGADPITTYVYTPLGGGCPAGLVSSVTDPDGDVTAYLYDSFGNETASYQGQTHGADNQAGDTWTFSNLAPGASRVYYVYAYASVGGGYSVTGNDGQGLPLTSSGSAPAVTVLGASGWTCLGQVVLDPGSSSLVVSYSGGSPAAAICLLQPMSTSVYDAQENLLSTTDGMGDVTASTYDQLGRPLTTAQGQTISVASNAALSFANLPQAGGQARNCVVYVQFEHPACHHRRDAKRHGQPHVFHDRLAHVPVRRRHRLALSMHGHAPRGGHKLGDNRQLHGLRRGDAGRRAPADLVHRLRRDGQRALADRRLEQRDDRRLQQPGAADFHLAGPDPAGQRANGCFRQPAADARPCADLHRLRAVVDGTQQQLHDQRRRQR